MSGLDLSIRDQHFYIDFIDRTQEYCMAHYHMHDDYEIYFLVSGERIYLIEEKKYQLHAGDMLFINRNTVHRTVSPTMFQHQRYVINFRTSFIAHLIDTQVLHMLFEKGPTVIHLPPEIKKNMIHLCNQMLREYEQREKYYNQVLQSMLGQLLSQAKRLYDNHLSLPVNADNQLKEKLRKVSNVIDYINEHYTKSITLDQIAEHAYMNVYYLCRIFKDITGLTVTEYVTLVRVKRAEDYLTNSDLKVSVIARKVGFATVPHFNRVFKKVTNQSPSQYRRAEAEG